MNAKSKFVFAFLLAMLTTHAAAQSLLFTVDRDLGKAMPTHARSWTVTLDAAAINAASPAILVPIPGKAPLLALRTRASGRSDGFVWHGRIGDKPVLITRSGNDVYASFNAGLEHYTISSQAVGSVLALVDQTSQPEDATTPVPRAPGQQPQQPQQSPAKDAVATGIIRLLVPYTVAARDAAGGEAEILAAAQFMVDQMNAIVTTSVLDTIHFELAGTMQIDYADGMNSDLVLTTLREDREVALMRDELAADLVIAVVEHSDLAGHAYLTNMLHVGNAPYGFATVMRSYGLNHYTFAHEVGHLMGLDHGGSSAPGNGAFSWARGFVGYSDANAGYPEGFVTIMAQLGYCGGSPPCHVIPYFSNPEMTLADAPVRGRAIGVLDQADNARAFREAVPYISQYRTDAQVRLFGEGFEVK